MLPIRCASHIHQYNDLGCNWQASVTRALYSCGPDMSGQAVKSDTQQKTERGMDHRKHNHRTISRAKQSTFHRFLTRTLHTAGQLQQQRKKLLGEL